MPKYLSILFQGLFYFKVFNVIFPILFDFVCLMFLKNHADTSSIQYWFYIIKTYFKDCQRTNKICLGKK